MAKKKIMLLRAFPEEMCKRISDICKGWKDIIDFANFVNWGLHRALSVYLRDEFDVIDILMGCKEAQLIWEKEFDIRLPSSIEKFLKSIPAKNTFFGGEDFYRILAKQIVYYEPDVIIILPIQYISEHFLKKMKSLFRFKLVGSLGATLHNIPFSLESFDAFFTTFYPAVFKMRTFGKPIKYVEHAFEPEVLKFLDKGKNKSKKYDIVFSGSLHFLHQSRKFLLERIVQEFGDRFHLFTQSESSLTPILRKVFRGKVFGIEHLKVLSESKIVINHHGDILPWAHNLRLFEATGVGSLLITDKLPNLENLFDVGKEVVAYSDADECISLIKKYLEDGEERDKIAQAGQKRTLRDHTYKERVNEIKKFLREYDIL